MRTLKNYIDSIHFPVDIDVDKFDKDYRSGKMMLDEKDYVSEYGTTDSSALFFYTVYGRIDSDIVKIDIETLTAGVPIMRVFLKNKSFIVLRGLDSGTLTKGTWVSKAILLKCGFSQKQIAKFDTDTNVRVYRNMNRKYVTT